MMNFNTESHHSIVVVSAIIYKGDELGSKKKKFAHHFHKPYLPSTVSMPGNMLVFQLKGSRSYFIIKGVDKQRQTIVLLGD